MVNDESQLLLSEAWNYLLDFQPAVENLEGIEKYVPVEL